MKVLIIYREVTPSSGSVSFNVSNLSGILTMIRVKPATSSTAWHLKITGPNGFITYESDAGASETGEVSDGGPAKFLGLMQGTYTVAISLAAVDEQFNVQLDVEQFLHAK